MSASAAKRLKFLSDAVPARIRRIATSTFEHKPSDRAWSKKEILGHLIDSAANNHQRFVRGKSGKRPQIWYEQDDWVKNQDYQSASRELLLDLWEAYNRHLAYLLEKLAPHEREFECIGKDGMGYTLEYLANDYVAHLEHHLEAIFRATGDSTH